MNVQPPIFLDVHLSSANKDATIVDEKTNVAHEHSSHPNA
jgi:hypothetical protein